MVFNLVRMIRGFGVGLPTGRRGFPKVLTASDGMSADVDCASGKYTKIWEYTIPAQQSITVGYGLPNTNETGRLFIDTEDTSGNDVDGWIRIAVANANETAIDVVFEQRTEILSENATDMTKWVSLPEIKSYPALGRLPKEDDRIQILFKPDSACTVDYGETIIFLPVTVYQ
ncbi:MAG: hypothetical protein ACTSWZ_00710 [Candidatus Heimdallarchaeaceae archaeon]